MAMAAQFSIYDEDGQLNGLIDPLGQPTMFLRDQAGRVAGVER